MAVAIDPGQTTSETTTAGSDGAAAPCTYVQATTDPLLGGTGGGGVGIYLNTATGERVDTPGPGVFAMYWRHCPGRGVEFVWAPIAAYVDRQALINGAYDEAISRIPVPSLNMSPRPEVGGIVNLGLWLAVNDPGQVNALAQAGPVWASVTVRFVGVTWNMGNGDVVNCDGLGVAYPEGSNQITEGPCGYTYTEQPPADGFTVTATAHWEAQLITSDGVNQMLDPIDMDFSFGYDVNEIITTGVG